MFFYSGGEDFKVFWMFEFCGVEEGEIEIFGSFWDAFWCVSADLCDLGGKAGAVYVVVS